MQTIKCHDPHAVENASHRIAAGSLKGVEIELPACSACHTGPKREVIEHGAHKGGLVMGVGYRGRILCRTDAFREEKKRHPELSLEQFEERLKPFRGPGVNYFYEYRVPTGCGTAEENSDNNHHNP